MTINTIIKLFYVVDASGNAGTKKERIQIPTLITRHRLYINIVVVGSFLFARMDLFIRRSKEVKNCD